jgi:endogenous inhibitor of DNA gyrase (YacG/DUF329 family)
VSAVEALLARLARDPDDDDDALWGDLYAAICNQGEVNAASYAAVPQLVAIAQRASAARAPHHWALVAAIANGAWSFPCPPSLRAAYEAALHAADAPIRAAIVSGPRDYTIWYLLGAAAAIRGLSTTAAAMEQFVESLFDVECPSCGETVEIAREDAFPGPPLASRDPAEWRWTDDDAPTRLLALARLAGRADVEAVLLQWDGTVSCPSCDAPFRLRPAQLSTLRSWSD